MSTPGGGYSAEFDLLYAAMGAQIGIAVQVSDFLNARGRLYAARAKSGDPELARLQIRRSLMMEPDVIWIVKGPESGQPKETPSHE
jgi:hypothetical protein